MGLQGITINGGYFDAGTAILVYSYQAPVIDNCIFSNNISTGMGGALLSLQGEPLLTNCLFFNNSALLGGAIASIAYSRVTMEGCVFRGTAPKVVAASSANMPIQPPSPNVLSLRTAPPLDPIFV